MTEPWLRAALVAGLLLHKIVWEVTKRHGRQPVPSRPTRSRITRVVKIAKIAVLAFLLLQTLALDLVPIVEQPGAIRVIGGLLFTLGLAISTTGRLQLGKSWTDLEDYTVLSGHALIDRGLYRYVRHPIYGGDLLLLVGLQLALNSWLFVAVLVPLVVVVRQVIVEEALLIERLPGYRDYCRRTKRFVPFLV